MFSKNAYQKRVMHSESDNIEIMVGQERHETMNGIFKFLLLRYQIGLQESMKYGGLVFDYTDFLYSKFYKIILNHAR